MNKCILVIIIAGIIFLGIGAIRLYNHLKNNTLAKGLLSENGISFNEEMKARIKGLEKRIKVLKSIKDSKKLIKKLKENNANMIQSALDNLNDSIDNILERQN
jgi:hypothetical protein